MVEVVKGPLGEGAEGLRRDALVPVLLAEPVANLHCPDVNVVSCLQADAADHRVPVGPADGKVKERRRVGRHGDPVSGVLGAVRLWKCVSHPSRYLGVVRFLYDCRRVAFVEWPDQTFLKAQDRLRRRLRNAAVVLVVAVVERWDESEGRCRDRFIVLSCPLSSRVKEDVFCAFFGGLTDICFR